MRKKTDMVNTIDDADKQAPLLFPTAKQQQHMDANKMGTALAHGLRHRRGSNHFDETTTTTDGTDYTLWSKDNTYFEMCRRHFIGNHTWGRPLAKYVDKAGVKNIVEAMNIDGLKIPKTLALYNKENISSFSLETMKQIPQPYIIKPTHLAGSVHRVKDDTLVSIKGDWEGTWEETHSSLMKDINLDFSSWHDEMQYKDVPHQIMIEEDVSNEIKQDVSYWYTSNGRPLFVSIQCSPTVGLLGTGQDRGFVNLNFQLLNLRLSKPACPELVRPSNWEKQVEIATTLAKGVPGIVRIDLYPGENSVIFSEITYTTQYCDPSYGFHPRVADGLLHAIQYGAIDMEAATPDLVRSIIHDRSWVLVQFDNDSRLVTPNSRAFPSPVDLCENGNSNHIQYKHPKWQDDDGVKKCLRAAKEVASSPLRCIVVSSSDTSNSPSFKVFSDEKVPTFSTVMGHVDWGRAITLLVLAAILTCMDVGTKKQKNQYLNNVLYLVAMLIVLRLTLPDVESTFSHHSILDTTKQSFRAFAYVHPMESTHIALCHFATYWFKIASWTSKSPRNLLLWQFLVESVTASVNEYSHLIESDDVVHCTRVLFKNSVKMCAFDNLMREYILPPFFVYGYLLPKFTFFWICKVPFPLWIGALMMMIGIFYRTGNEKLARGKKKNMWVKSW